MSRRSARDALTAKKEIRWLYLLAAIAPFVALAVVWLPEFRHWHVERVTLSDEALARALQDVRSPAAAELERFDLPGLRGFTGERLLEAVKAIEAGELTMSDGRMARIDPAFVPDDLDAAPLDLEIASLAVPNVQLRAWRATRDVHYLRMARNYILRWMEFERSRALPRGMQWNDHAIAARVFVLVSFLSATRDFNELTRDEAREVLECVLESGARLGKPAFYTFRTNHGVMQNLALLHIGAALPSVPEAKQLAQLGAQRFARQQQYYMTDEGVIIEHSAGYQEFGLELLGLAVREFELLRLEMPRGLRENYGRALAVYADLLRPDGSLPPWGDTRATDRSAPIADTNAPFRPRMTASRRSLFAPVAGLAVIWQPTEQGGSQTLVTWSDFATGAHKQRDEMSLYLWADGAEVIVGPGYWPYASPLWAGAVGWRGSNAPHFESESNGSKSATALLGHASSTHLEFFDLQRSLLEGGAHRRQIVLLRPNVWLVLDASLDAGVRSTIVNWTLDPAAVVNAAPDTRRLVVQTRGSGRSFQLRILGCEGGSLALERGSEVPFAGWTSYSGRVQPARSLVRRCPPGAWAASLVAEAGSGSPAEGATVAWTGPEEWTLADAAGQTLAGRRGGTLTVRNPNGSGYVNAAVQPEPAYEREGAQINDRYRAMGAEYVRYKESHLYYRFKVTLAIAAVWLAELLLMIPLLRWAFTYSTPLGRTLGAAPAVFWLLLAVWLHRVYFSG